MRELNQSFTLSFLWGGIFLLKFKVCGLTRVEDAEKAVYLGANAIGVIIGAESKRRVSLEQARAILEKVPSSCWKVGVVADVPVTEAYNLARDLNLDLLQLHGRESPAYCSALKWPAVKAWSVVYRDGSQLRKELEPFLQVVEAILLDNNRGGSGQNFDWTVLQNLRLPKPVWIAGGLNAENIPKLLEIFQPDLVDVNSGVESQPGIKDAEKMARVAAIIRRF
ncbi:phosphoribosylanthranilate isomerase [Carboxydocella thermautotrophica]|uniref:N-(5'-phosphoribosyl)anthranilate isomerase n=1 Tax=Carboxydocella thermautotrophica TaxID=178899 RepID=A0A2R4MZX5_CARTR|nr:phosphoribosylanthranilate isomerase [Carboxydocella thermautotrophica]